MTIYITQTNKWMQEVGSYRPAIRPERRRQMQQEVEAAAPHALQILASCLNQRGSVCSDNHPSLSYFLRSLVLVLEMLVSAVNN